MHYTQEPRLCSSCYLCLPSPASFIFAFSTPKRHRLELMHLAAFELIQRRPLHGPWPFTHSSSSRPYHPPNQPHTQRSSAGYQLTEHSTSSNTHSTQSHTSIETYHQRIIVNLLSMKTNDKGNARDTVRERHEAEIDGLREGPDFPVGDEGRCEDR